MQKYGVDFCAQHSQFNVKKNGDKVVIKCTVCSQKTEKQKNSSNKTKVTYSKKTVIYNLD